MTVFLHFFYLCLMIRLITHIEYLLHEHNCVIIPDFGGFVVNTIPPKRDGIATFHAPVCELVFNRDLIHNDGLLAQSYMRDGSLTFDSAMLKLEKDVQELKHQLREQRRVDLGKLGSFDMHDEKRFVYTRGSFVRPSLFGLTQATLKPLIQIQPALANRKNENKRVWSNSVGITAAAVVALLLLMFILPVSDTNFDRQSAQMISETGWMHAKAVQPKTNTAFAEDVLVESDEEVFVETDKVEDTVIVLDGAQAPDSEISIQSEMIDSPRYYIIMGVFRGFESAQKTSQQLLDEGFHQSGLLERPDRIDVYAASFTDKNAAEVYLREVHKKFPSHSDAWILKK